MTAEQEMEGEILVQGLATLLKPAEGASLNRRQGVVTAIATGPPTTVTVTIGNTAVPGVRVFETYFPTVNDVVFLDFDGETPVVIGQLSNNNVALARGIMAAPVGDPVGVGAIALGAGTTETVRMTTPAFVVPPGRTLELKGFVHYNKGTSTMLQLRCRRGTTASSTPLLGTINWPTVAAAFQVVAPGVWLDEPPAGSVQYVFDTAFDTGTGDIYNPSHFVVKDIGHAT